jgi:putative ABC transport system permease protein
MTRKEFRWLLLKQALLQKKSKALLMLLAVTMGASVVAALFNLQTDLRQRMNRELRDYGPNVAVLPSSEGGLVPSQFLATIRTSPIRERMVAYTPQLFVPVQIQNLPVLLVGVDVDGYRKLFPSHDWNLHQAVSTEAIYLGTRFAKKIRAENQKSLDIIGASTITLPVAGFVESGEAEDDQVFVPIRIAQQLSGKNGGYHAVLFSVLGDLPEVEQEFAAVVRGNVAIKFQVIRKIATAESSILDKISRLMGLVISLIFVILFFCIHTTVSAILLSRQSEIALLRVLGARRRQITAVLTSELLVLGLIGGVSGYTVGMIMAQLLGKTLFQSYVTPSGLVFLITLLFSLLLMIVSSILPISRAVNRQAALVLKEA